MSKPRALLDLMTAVDASPMVAADDDGANLVPRRRGSYGRSRQTAPAVAPASPMESEASFEFSAMISNSSASPASMVFSDGQLRAHQFPAVRSSAAGSQVGSPVLSPSMGGSGTTTGSKKRVSFAADGTGKTAEKPGGGPKKGGGMLGCMGSACGLSSRDEVVEPTMNANRKVVCV